MDNSVITMVTERGQTSIPASLRKAAGLKTGARLRWRRVSDNVFHVEAVKPKRKPNPLAMLGFAKQFNPTEKRGTDAIMRELREGDAD